MVDSFHVPVVEDDPAVAVYTRWAPVQRSCELTAASRNTCWPRVASDAAATTHGVRPGTKVFG